MLIRTIAIQSELMSPGDTGLLVVDVQEKLLAAIPAEPATGLEHSAADRRGENSRHAGGGHRAVSQGPWRNGAGIGRAIELHPFEADI